MNSKFWKGIFSEADGTPSFARVSTAAIIACSIGWITYVVATKFLIPELGGLAAVIGTLYGSNRISAAISSFGNKKTDDKG